jgi:hypothetical protein
MPNTYTLISSYAVTSNTSSYTFSSIPQTYTDLLLCYSARTTLSPTTYGNLQLRFNGDNGNNYSFRMVYGNASSANSAETIPYSGIQWAYASTDGSTANTFGQGNWYIPNYTGSTAKTTLCNSVSEDNATLAIQSVVQGLWSGTQAITSITVSPSGGTSDLKQYSNFYLYGIKNS